MTDNIVLDFGVDIGDIGSKEECYFKFKVGRGQQEVSVLKQTVESGTGETLDDSEYTFSVHFSDGDVSKLKESISEMSPNEDAGINVIEGKVGGGNWLQLHPKQAGGEEIADFVPKYEEMLNEFFADVKSNCFVEFAFRSAHSFTEVLEVSKKNGETAFDDSANGELPSLLTLLNNASLCFRSDIEHKFIVDILTFLNKKSGKFPGVDAKLFAFIEKLNGLEMKWNLAGAHTLHPKHTRDMMGPALEMMQSLCEMVKADEMEDMFSLANGIKMYFLLRDDIYLYMDVKLPGFSDMIAHMRENFAD